MFQRLSRRFIAGDRREHALGLTREDNELGIHGMVNFLGEHYEEREPVEETVEEYKRVAEEMERRDLDAELSVKLTQLGLLIDEDFCRDNLREVLKLEPFVWIDMEATEHVETTVDIFYDMFETYDDVGLTLQARLERTKGDVREMANRGAPVRLVKGAYPAGGKSVGDEAEVLARYKELLEILFAEGDRFAAATHNSELVRRTAKLAEEYVNEPEFQMLLGVREGLQARMAAEGFEVGEYIPYGTRWWEYFLRRVSENRWNAFRAVKDFFWYDHSRLARVHT